MSTVTITKEKYEILKKQASLYERFFKTIPKKKWGGEDYTNERIRAFMNQDRIDKKTILRLKKLLNAGRFS